MKNKIELVQRINSSIAHNDNSNINNIQNLNNLYSITQYHRTNITINQSTNIFTIEMFNETIINNALLPMPENIDFLYTYIYVTHYNHNLKKNDIVLFNDILSFKKIPAKVINNSFIINEIVDSSHYIVLLPKYSNNGNELELKSGWSNKIRSPIYFRLLFNKQNTIGEILDFKNCGNPKSITEFKILIKNNDLYENNYLLNEYTNNININFRNILLCGDNYILMVSSVFKNSIITNWLWNVFAKLFLSNYPGTYVFNDFIQLNDEFAEPIKTIWNIDFSFYDPRGNLYDFCGMEHSFTIAIYEKLL